MYFGLGCLRVDDAILSRNLVAVPALVSGFLCPVFLELLLEARLELPDLAVLDVVVVRPRGIRFEELDLVFDAGV